MEKVICFYDSPVGKIRVEGGENGMSKLVFVAQRTSQVSSPNNDGSGNQVNRNLTLDEMSSQWIKQLDEYFTKKRTDFDLELDLQGTDFQQSVWKELLTIPYGKTVSYKELAMRKWDLKTIRAVAAANGANPVSIIVPCHRVIGSDGSLTGYAGGLWRKQWLLELEKGQPSLML